MTLMNYTRLEHKFLKDVSETDYSVNELYKTLMGKTFRLSELYELIGKSDKAVSSLNKALEYAKISKDKYKEGKIKEFLGWILKDKGELDKSLDILISAKDLLEKYDKDRITYADCLNSIGMIYAIKGDDETYYKYIEKALKISEEIGNKKSMAVYLANLSRKYESTGEYDKLLEYAKKALDLSLNQDDKKLLANTYINMGIAYYYNGNLDKLLQYSKSAAQLEMEIGNKKGLARALTQIGIVYHNKTQYKLSIKYFKNSANIYNHIGYKIGFALSLTNIGNVYYDTGNFNQALKYYRVSLSVFKELNFVNYYGYNYYFISYTYTCMGRYKEALEIAFIHQKNIRDTGQDVMQGKSYIVIGLILSEDGSLEKDKYKKELLDKISTYTNIDKTPESYFKKAIEIAVSNNNKENLVPALYEYGRYLYKHIDKSRGIKKLKEARENALSFMLYREKQRVDKICEDLNIDKDKISVN